MESSAGNRQVARRCKVSDTPRTDRAANESIVRVYETSKQLERELAAAKDLAESNGKLAHDLGIKCEELRNQLNFLSDYFPTEKENKQP
jgi:hypothetical protein